MAALPDFDVLSQIVGSLVVPGEVIAELEAGGAKDLTAARVKATHWCEVRQCLSPFTNPLISSLGTGEAAVIQTALNDHRPLVIIDEVRGRRAARLAGLSVIGSLGLLVELRHARLLPSVSEAIERMRKKGIFLAQNIIDVTLKAANESAGN